MKQGQDAVGALGADDWAKQLVHLLQHTALPNDPVSFDASAFSPAFVREIIDGVINRAEASAIKIQGIRMDPSFFGSLGIPLDSNNSGHYRNIVVVMSDNIDHIEFVRLIEK